MPFPQIILPSPSPKSPKDCSRHLCLFCCLAYRVIITIFLIPYICNILYLCFFFFYFILLYNTVLVFPYIDMNPPQVYMSSQSWTPPSPYHLSGSSQCTSPKHPVSNLDWWFVSYMIAYMFQCHSPKSSHPRPLPQSPKTVLYICVSFAVSHTGLSLPSF